ncbi:MAG TPA: alpha/beta fold hydrolase [Albitalea sp.]|nr:alpha/beta fold hydrolase [Albitalea sp.]
MNDRVSFERLRAPSRWFARFHEPRRPSLRLFCFPYAGGSASVFRHWARQMDPRIDVVAVQLPGRGPRLDEAPWTEFDGLSAVLADAVAHEAGALRFAFFGHSMGALLMFEVARRLAAAGARTPECVFASGRQAPHLPQPRLQRHRMNDADFIDELRRLQGTPAEILDNPELLAILMPTIRGDFALLDSWAFADSAPLALPLYALAGRSDAHVALDAARQWQRWTGAEFELISYSGGHFFLHEQEPLVVHDVSQRLNGWLFG